MTQSNIIPFPLPKCSCPDHKYQPSMLSIILHDRHMNPKYISYTLDIPIICIERWIAGYPIPYQDSARLSILLDVDQLLL